MDSDTTPKKKNLGNNDSTNKKDGTILFDGKTLYDLYRHTTKLIK